MILYEATTDAILDELRRRFDTVLFAGVTVHTPADQEVEVYQTTGSQTRMVGLATILYRKVMILAMNRDGRDPGDVL